MLYHNNGDGTFARVTEGEVVNTAATSSGGATWVDSDNDGFLDLFFVNGHERAREASFLFKNSGNTNRWLSVRCLGAASNRSGIGATVHVKATIGGVERWQVRELTGGNGFNSSGLRTHFGLGDARFASIVRVEWPSGIVSERRNVTANQILPMKEPPLLTMSRTNANGVALTLKGGRGIPYTVEYSANLASWQRMTNFTPTNMLTTVADSLAESGNRFYRAREGN